ncbi:hypothetical protein LTR36_004640 [Oleoguttula mirabilis]|uniref:DUF6697 domain-containing protein n=1 Tax=Oleoguttula mirabilis TaxID=1507867 RepID=A0AAV9JG81_9PEZI|nr:hypothetical protein LTR36_004640 [Oleoguttula mirabilis]
MDHSFGSDILHDNMNSMAFPGGAYVHPPNYQQTPRFHQQLAHHQPSNQLNPSMPPFLPTGTELQRYGAAAELTPPHTPVTMRGSAMTDMQRYVAETHIKHTSDIVHVEHMVRKNQQDIHDTQEIVGSDLRKLDAQMQRLQMQVNQQASGGQSLAVVRAGPGILDIEIPSPEVMLQRFDKGTVAALYAEQAEKFEELAARLRSDFDELVGGEDSGMSKVGEAKLLEASVQDRDNDVRVIVNGSNVETPTHMPTRRVQREHSSRAVDIKAPAESGAVDALAATEPADNATGAQHQSTTDRVAIRPAAHTSTDSKTWQPLGVRKMPAPPAIDISDNVETFTWEFLQLNLHGAQWSPGYYFIAHESRLKSKAYWVLDGEYEPFLPSAPGQHGAKLTAFFNSTLSERGEAPTEFNYQKTPVFVRAAGSKEYVYYGDYSQRRYSDRLDYDRVMESVPAKVRTYWAEQLTAEARPGWVTKSLMEHLWPKPTYDEPIPTDETIASPASAESAATDYSAVLEKRVSKGLRDYAQELKEWEKDARMQVSLLKEVNLERSFAMADADEKPALRLWWEYLQFAQYDQELYEGLVTLKGMEGPAVGAGKIAAPATKARREKGHSGAASSTVKARERATERVESKVQPDGESTTAPAVAAQSPQQAMQAREEASKAEAAAVAAAGKVVSVPASGIETVHPTPAPAAAPSKPSPATAINNAVHSGTTAKRRTGGTKPWEKTAVAAEVPGAEKKTSQTTPEQLQQLHTAKEFAKTATRAKEGGGARGKPPHLRK